VTFAFLIPLGLKDPARDFGVPSTKHLGQLVITVEHATCLWRSVPEMIAEADRALLDRAGGQHRHLEGYVFMHEDTEVCDPNVLHKLRKAFKDPYIGVVGVYGADRITGLAWWDGRQKGRFPSHVPLRGLNGYPDPPMGYVDHGDPEVDCVDGCFMAISPWVAHNVPFDSERFHGFHGFDVDFCLEVWIAGKKVVVSDIDIWHHTRNGYGDPNGALGGYPAWLEANAIFKEKWHLA
jgi:GT2 family glycosyltransferase